MHVELSPINLDEVITSGPLPPDRLVRLLSYAGMIAGFLTFGLGVVSVSPARTWASFYVSLLFFMGLAAGGVMISVIFQIVRATWSGPVRRFAEAGVAFLPAAYLLLLCTWFGKEHLFPWANAPRPGTESWMEPGFVYARFAVLLLVLFYMMWRFVAANLRGDVGLARERTRTPAAWDGWFYDRLTSEWRGIGREVATIQPSLSRFAPLLAITYAVVYSLFAFEMVMSTDRYWMSNLFGAFLFMGNVYLAWAVLGISSAYHKARYPQVGAVVTGEQFWDIGKLTFGFCMIWGYFFFSQFLPQWYGNMPEETQFMILRTREYPWKALGWIAFSCAFVAPFVLLLSRDLKRTPGLLAVVCLIVFGGIWFEKYLIIMPQVSPDSIPLGLLDLGIFAGFLGLYVWCVQTFLSYVPYVPLAHPLTHGETDW